MDADHLDALDVEAAILTGDVEQVQTLDPRGVRYVVVGSGCDQISRVGVVVRFVEDDQLLVITVYGLKGEHDMCEFSCEHCGGMVRER